MGYLLSLDQGTTSSRSILFDLEGTPLHTAQQEFRQHFPHTGWVEHDAEEIWRTQLETARAVLSRAEVRAGEVEAIGISNQRETTVVWERSTGRPLAPAIVWQDRRVAPTTDRMRAEGLEPTVRAKTGLLLDPYFSAPKLAWLLDNVEGLRARAEAGELCFGTIDSWLIFRLTGGRVHATDVSNASRTLMFDINTVAWDDELLELFSIPRAVLPEVVTSSGMIGETDADLLGAAIPIAGVAGDQQAALFGQACFSPGMAKNTYGTGAFVVMNTGETPASGEGVLTTLAWQLQGQKPVYAVEGSIFIAGAAVQWLRDGLNIIDSALETEAMAEGLEDNGDVYFVPALTGLGAPHWDPHARGVIIGITRGTTRAHLVRAALEAMAYQTADAIRAMEAAGGTRLKQLRVDGGAAANNWLLQFQADLLSTPVVRPTTTETTALGAAYLAGVGAGILDPGEIAGRWRQDRVFDPGMGESARRDLLARWSRAVEHSRGWAGRV